VRPIPGRDVPKPMLGGYLPLAAFLVVCALLVAFVPSVPRSDTAAVGAGGAVGVDGVDAAGPGRGSPGGSGPGGATATTLGGAAASGPAAPPGTPGGTVALADTCPGGARQTREPYSPPCITFEGDNGGATAPGVTADTITVTFREGDLPSVYAVAGQVAEKANIRDTQDDIRRTIEAYVEYFNEHFQMYGRRVETRFFKGQGDQLSEFFGGGAEGANADALQVAQEIGAFADLSVLTTPYAEALVRQKVIAIPPVHMSQRWYEEHAPYSYGVLVDCSRLASSLVDWTMKRLWGRSAQYAGDPAFRGQQRRIGLIVPEEPWYQECANSGVAELEARGGAFAHRINYTLDFQRLSQEAAGMIAQMKDRGVTTVACMCDPVLPLFLTTQATQQEYRPEWVVTGTALTDVDLLGQIYDPEQWRHAFGISFLNDIHQGVRSESYRAYKAVRDDEPAFIHDILYYPMLMMFLGIHLAGPELTPETFQQGLFSYPPTAGETGRWSFSPGDRTATDDAREMYWDPNAVSPFNGEPGRWVTTLEGNRYITDWPEGDAVFPITP
jgi:hypothetical protein